MNKLKQEYQDMADEFEMNFGNTSCSCHLNPPCSYCIDEGNPKNLEQIDDAWEEVKD